MPSQVSSSPLHILYLANYAPISRTQGTPDDSEGWKYSRYHREMLSLLESLGFMVTPARNVKALIDHFTEYDYVFSLLNRAPYREFGGFSTEPGTCSSRATLRAANRKPPNHTVHD